MNFTKTITKITISLNVKLKTQTSFYKIATVNLKKMIVIIKKKKISYSVITYI